MSCSSVLNVIYLAVDCGTLSAPLNGSVQGSVTTFPNVLQLGCDRGFTLEGSNVRKCQANATWSGRTTFCKGVEFVSCLFLPLFMFYLVRLLVCFFKCHGRTIER